MAGPVRARKKWMLAVATGVLALALGSYGILHVSADTAVLVPDGDITAAWGNPGTGGTNDGSCASGTHCNFVDEGATDNTADYVTTAGKTAASTVEEYSLTSVPNVSSASQVVVRIYVQTTVVGGGTADTLTINLRVNGALQTAGSCTPAASWAACTVTFTGSWNQTAVDSMQVYIMRNLLGSGTNANKADTIQMANVYATLTYVPTLSVGQSAYRWFNNQDAASTFVKTYGGTSGDYNYGNSLIQTSDGGYATTGYTYSYGGGDADMYLAKYDASGNLSWSRTWGGAGDDEGHALIQTSDGGFAVTGETTTYGVANDDMFVAKYDASGTLSWSKTWGGTDYEKGHAIIQTSDGGYAVVGYTYSFGAGGKDAILVKYTSTGALSWSRTWGGSASHEEGISLVQTSDGGYVMTGYTGSFGAGNEDIFLVKYNNSGTLSWSKTWGGAGTDQATALVQTSDGGFAVGGWGGSFSPGNDLYLIKYDASGNVSWNKTWGGSGDKYASSLVQTSDGGYALSGNTTAYGAGSDDSFLVKFDSSGGLSWARTWGGIYGDFGNSLVQAGDGGYMVAGYTESYGAGSRDMFLAKYDASGNISGCSSPMCQSPSASTGSPTATTGSPAASSASAAATAKSPAAGNTSPSMTTTSVVANTTIGAGSPLAAANTAITTPGEGTIFRLRLNLHISGSTVNTNTLGLKLQYAPKGGAGSCSAVTTGAFADVTNSTAVSYARNALASNGMPLATGGNDPVHGTDTTIPQAYYQKDTAAFYNTAGISANQDGMWDFALQTSQALQNTTYCLRLVKTGGTVLNSYSVYPELTTPVASFSQAAYRWYDREPTGVSFAQTWSGNGVFNKADEGYSVVKTSDGGYAVTGNTTSFGGGSWDMFLAKYDQMGTLSWSRTWGDTDDDIGNSLIQTSDGGYAVTGYTASYGNDPGNSYDMFVAKYNSSGTLSWSRTWGGADMDSGGSLIQTSDGGYAVTGTTASFGPGSGSGIENMFLAKYDSSGSLSWSRVWGGAAGPDYGYDLVQASDGGYVITGVTNYGAGNGDMFLAKYTSTGTLSWSRTWGGNSGTDGGTSIVQTSDGGFAVAGYTASYGAGGYDIFLAKYDSSGTLSWSKTWGGTGDDEATALVQTSDGGYAVGGLTNSYGAGGYDALVLKYDSSGTLSWSNTWGDTKDEYGFYLAQASDGGYAVTGSTKSYGDSMNGDMFLTKFDSSGNIPGCTSPTCQSPTGSTGSPSATTQSPSAASSSLSPTVTSPSAGTSSPSAKATFLIRNMAIGNPMAPLNKPLDLLKLLPLSLRVAVRVDGSGIAASGQDFKLQYAIRANEATCADVGGGAFADVTTATPIAYYDDIRYTSGQTLVAGADDLTDGSRTLRPQTYQEANNFTNSTSLVYAGETAVWQFSLNINNATLKGRDFCLRVATSAGTGLTTLNVPDVAYAPMMEQRLRHGTWFSRTTEDKQGMVAE